MIPISNVSPRVRKYTGEGGVTILHQDNPTSRAFCAGVWVNSGSRDERAGEEGLCHFLEHMVFKGTRHRSVLDISQDVEKVGGSIEAFTTKEQVCLYVQLLEHHKELAFDILSDMILNSTFPAEQLALERQVVLEEINDVMDAPDDLIHDLFASEIFPGHPLGKPILGSPETVGGFDRERLRRFAKRIFRASNMIISVVGRIDRRRLLRLCEWTGRLPSGNVARRAPRITRYQPIRRLHRRRLHQQHICIGARSYSYLDEKRYPLMVLTTLLGGTMSSRLFQRIREQLGYTYSIYTYADSARDTGLLGTYVAVKPANARRVVQEVFREFDKLRRKGVPANELLDTKEHLKGRILLGLETSASKMMRMARNEIYFGRQIPERELIARIDRVTMDDVMSIADEMLDATRNTVVSLGPSAAGLNVA